MVYCLESLLVRGRSGATACEISVVRKEGTLLRGCRVERKRDTRQLRSSSGWNHACDTFGANIPQGDDESQVSTRSLRNFWLEAPCSFQAKHTPHCQCRMQRACLLGLLDFFCHSVTLYQLQGARPLGIVQSSVRNRSAIQVINVFGERALPPVSLPAEDPCQERRA